MKKNTRSRFRYLTSDFQHLISFSWPFFPIPYYLSPITSSLGAKK